MGSYGAIIQAVRDILRSGVWGWLLRLCLGMFLLTQIAAPDARAVLGEPQTVITTQPLLCVHTRLIDEVHDWKILRSLQLIREMGAATIVEFFPWAYVEATQGYYDWSRVDTIMTMARNQGIRVYARVGLVPEWARSTAESSTLNTLPETSDAAFAQYTAALAERYSDVLAGIIVWNEPNLAFEWGFAAVDAARYMRLLQVVYPQIKRRAPSVVVLAGAMAPTNEPEGSPAGMSDLIYLQRLYEAGAQSYFDVLAVHTYGLAMPPQTPPDTAPVFRRPERLFEIMRQFGDSQKPVVITEFGWNDYARWSYAVRPSQRVQYTIQAYDYVRQHWQQVQQMCVWMFRTPAPTWRYGDGYALSGTDFDLKPLYFALQQLAANTQHSETLWLPAPAR